MAFLTTVRLVGNAVTGKAELSHTGGPRTPAFGVGLVALALSVAAAPSRSLADEGGGDGRLAAEHTRGHMWTSRAYAPALAR